MNSRRTFMAAGLGALIGDAGAAAKEIPPLMRPKDVGRKFESDGRVRPFAGSTIICHLPQQGAGYQAFDRLLDIYRDLPGLAFARKVTALPTSSYHMTVFSGPTDQGRNAGNWPSTVPLDAAMADCDAELHRRLEAFRTRLSAPIKMVVDDSRSTKTISPITVPLRPADESEAGKLRRLRDRLARTLDFRSADHDAYHYHITIGYQIELFTAAERAEYESAMARWISSFKRDGLLFEFGAPEYCVFRDMFAFERKILLRR